MADERVNSSSLGRDLRSPPKNVTIMFAQPEALCSWLDVNILSINYLISIKDSCFSYLHTKCLAVKSWGFIFFDFLMYPYGQAQIPIIFFKH